METFMAVVDEKQRNRTAANHTATHLLHQALRTHLGTHVEQKGSMVHSGIFRFDFSHFTKLEEDDLKAIEQFVNARIQEQLPLKEKRAVSYQEALDAGAIALFGEKYGDQVRTIQFGQSVELCGGTHVSNTAALWYFKIVSESAVAAGVRRIEAITGDATKKHFEEQAQLLDQVQALLHQPQNTLKAIEQLQAENTALKKETAALNKLKQKAIYDQLKSNIKNQNGISLLTQKINIDAQGMKSICFDLAKEYDALVVVLGAENQGKALLSCFISPHLVETKNWNAAQLIRTLGQYIQGGGGGQNFFATAGGKNPNGIVKALEEVPQLLA